ncbi:MAG: imidazolonepropionase [Spirochaetes bacterium]|nr:imidazolonepropionase [Spirochaetota bacterium]
MVKIVHLKDIYNLYGFDLNGNFFNFSNCDIILINGKYYYLFLEDIFEKKITKEKFNFSNNFIIYYSNYEKENLIEKILNTLIQNEKIQNYKLEVIDCNQKTLTPSFVDPHTHAIFHGSREKEFFLRNQGISYLEIAKMGGGISYSVKLTREASEEILLKNLLQRIFKFSQFGVSHIEIKSGYGLTKNDEIKILKIINKAKEYTNIQIFPTCLAAHDYPPEYKFDYPEKKYLWVETIINEIIPEVKSKNLAIFFDIFSEEKVFDLKNTERILTKAKEVGFKLKIHSDELSNIGATELACQLGAVSADHLLKISEKGLEEIKKSKTIPVLLPGTAFYLNEPFAPFDKFKEKGIEVAIGSDFNPGTNCTENILLIYTISAIKLKMNAMEILKASTYTSSKAIDLEDNENVGIINKGKDAFINIFNAPNLEYIYYHWGINHLHKSLIKGEDPFIKYE